MNRLLGRLIRVLSRPCLPAGTVCRATKYSTSSLIVIMGQMRNDNTRSHTIEGMVGARGGIRARLSDRRRTYRLLPFAWQRRSSWGEGSLPKEASRFETE